MEKELYTKTQDFKDFSTHVGLSGHRPGLLMVCFHCSLLFWGKGVRSTALYHASYPSLLPLLFLILCHLHLLPPSESPKAACLRVASEAWGCHGQVW